MGTIQIGANQTESSRQEQKSIINVLGADKSKPRGECVVCEEACFSQKCLQMG